MPHYEFFCQECKKLFDKILSLVDYEEGEVLCPHCGSKKVEQWSAFSASTVKKGARTRRVRHCTSCAQLNRRGTKSTVF